MKIGPVLDVKLYPHEGRYCIDIMIEALFKDPTVSWVRDVNGINKDVTETSQEIPTKNVELFITTGKLVAKAEPKPKSVVNSSINVPIRERKWIDIDPQPFDRSCFAVSKFMTRTLRHDSSIPREEDGVVRFDDLVEKLKEEFVSTLQWTVKTWASSLAQGGGRKKRFQYCLNPYSSNKFLYLREIQGHAREIFVDPLLQDNVLLPDDFAEYIYHIGNAYEMHSIFQSGQIPGGKSNRRDRQSVFFTAVNPIDIQPDRREVEYDLDKPRIAPYKHTWRAHHNTVYWCNLKQKDVHISESRKSDDREKDYHRETCGSDYCVDFRIPGIPRSAVEQVEATRKEKVRR